MAKRWYYVGSTNNIKRRLKEHNNGIGGKYTKDNIPFKLIFYEAFLNKEDATKDELFFLKAVMVEKC